MGFELSDKQKGVAWKCNFCHTSVDNTFIPDCVDNVCTAYCMCFGEPEEIK